MAKSRVEIRVGDESETNLTAVRDRATRMPRHVSVSRAISRLDDTVVSSVTNSGLYCVLWDAREL